MSEGQFREEKAIAQWLKTLCRLLYNTFVIAIRCYNNYCYKLQGSSYIYPSPVDRNQWKRNLLLIFLKNHYSQSKKSEIEKEFFNDFNFFKNTVYDCFRKGLSIYDSALFS